MANTPNPQEKPGTAAPAGAASIITPAPLAIPPTPWEVAQANQSASLARLQVLKAEVESLGSVLIKEDPDFHYIYVPVDVENEGIIKRRFIEGNWEIVQEASIVSSNMWVLRILKSIKQERYGKALAAFNAVVGILHQDRVGSNPDAVSGKAAGQFLTEEQLKSTPRTILG
jgi:hypothetical protein